jgi:hypothetical protein
MKIMIITLGLLSCIFSLSSNANKMTEQFIPIGNSPGVSYKQTSIGIIDSIDSGKREISVTEINGAQKRYIISDKTWVWLDNSKQRKTNSIGEFENCEVGQMVEVMPLQDQPDKAEWVKLELIRP